MNTIIKLSNEGTEKSEKVKNMSRLWSVEHEANSWNDDMFNGTFQECVEYCKEHDYKIDGVECRLAEIELDKVGCVIYTYNIVNEV